MIVLICTSRMLVIWKRPLRASPLAYSECDPEIDGDTLHSAPVVVNVLEPQAWTSLHRCASFANWAAANARGSG